MNACHLSLRRTFLLDYKRKFATPTSGNACIGQPRNSSNTHLPALSGFPQMMSRNLLRQCEWLTRSCSLTRRKSLLFGNRWVTKICCPPLSPWRFRLLITVYLKLVRWSCERLCIASSEEEHFTWQWYWRTSIQYCHRVGGEVRQG